MAALPVDGIEVDSRCVKPGDVFLAVNGEVLDGRDFIASSVQAGAVAVIADAPCAADDWSLPVVEVECLSEKVSDIAGRFYDHPSRQLNLIGITGTNGKTSCSWLMAQLLEFLGQPCGLMGTIGSGRVGDLTQSVNTTPGALMVQRQLSEWRDAGAKWAAMEVSSHGLVQHRVEALHFDAAVFTNLSRDHLDYHGSMDAYKQAKSKLFSWSELPLAVINRDDDFGRELIAQSAAMQMVDFSLSDPQAAVYLSDVDCTASGCRARLHSPWGVMTLSTGLIGDFNLANITACCAVLLAKGFVPEEVERAVPELEPVPGRMQCFRTDDDVLVVVDYAHTDDALSKALSALRSMTRNKLCCVFGCGGDRDQGKRPIMGAVASELADQIILTSDNPRSENPSDIIADIAKGTSTAGELQQILDRAAAIEIAVVNALPGDVVLVAGKGHENYQEINGQRTPFSDVAHVQRAIHLRQQGGGQ
ncbi:UDP-N-acetylmuramoyl-L-alanyl-D-glutamate--2,6-diaminopimelate ligase [Spongiibacter sp. KMU-158]|uniref:UDP-N-acetylmuramoyl-L-alanyl-D-glutamate--2,6-diaminopimelate ligase n=2 Tax=Spongiibacter pelagi TaxID=2760804 RepID=A0A927C5E4_9GAMM|nr:UDP-N-acetylmuramoyl-L-alanyl-D-glutamate--2,6-diaminopimelate ligase [Spongiibacter pelagi]